MENSYLEHKAEIEAKEIRNKELKEIGGKVAMLISDNSVAIKEVRTILDFAESKILSVSKATI